MKKLAKNVMKKLISEGHQCPYFSIKSDELRITALGEQFLLAISCGICGKLFQTKPENHRPGARIKWQEISNPTVNIK